MMTGEKLSKLDRRRCAEFSVVRTEYDRIFLVDEDGPVSVTNYAEGVCEWASQAYPGKRIVYRDTLGRWDEIITTLDGRFVGFAPYSEPMIFANIH